MVGRGSGELFVWFQNAFEAEPISGSRYKVLSNSFQLGGKFRISTEFSTDSFRRNLRSSQLKFPSVQRAFINQNSHSHLSPLNLKSNQLRKRRKAKQTNFFPFTHEIPISRLIRLLKGFSFPFFYSEKVDRTTATASKGN
jgi:hypothetical protein